MASLLPACPLFALVGGVPSGGGVAISAVPTASLQGLGAGGGDTAKAFEAAAAHSQWLTSLALLVIGGSMLVLLHRDYIRPASSIGRSSFLLFLVGWACLAFSIWKGARAQQVYLACLVTPPTTAARVAHLKVSLGLDLDNQIAFMGWGLIVFAIWLLVYLIWWISGGDLRDRVRESAGPGGGQGGIAFCLAMLGLLMLPMCVAAECDCDHYPYRPNPPCYTTCSQKVLSYSSAAALTILGIEMALAHELVQAKQRNQIHSFSDLPPSQQAKLDFALQHANPVLLKYLASPPQEKAHLVAMLKQGLQQQQLVEATQLAERQATEQQRLKEGQARERTMAQGTAHAAELAARQAAQEKDLRERHEREAREMATKHSSVKASAEKAQAEHQSHEAGSHSTGR
jgi:hypothetical protein